MLSVLGVHFTKRVLRGSIGILSESIDVLIDHLRVLTSQGAQEGNCLICVG